MIPLPSICRFPYFGRPARAETGEGGAAIGAWLVEMLRLLPNDEDGRQRWLNRSGQPPKNFPLSTFLECRGRPYLPTDRYILNCVVLAGFNFPMPVLRDERGWAMCCEQGGLFAFVVHRAIECAAHYGMEAKAARTSFIPMGEKTPATVRRPAPWSVGYHGGLCTILASDVGNTDELYLAKKSGYHVPFLDAPIF